MNKKIYLLITSLFLVTIAFGQQEKAIKTAKKYLQENLEKWDLTPADISDIVVDNILTSEHNGVTHIYLRQRYRGIKIHNAISTINILPNGEILQANNRFLPNIASAVNTSNIRITPETAIQKVVNHLDIKQVVQLSNKENRGRNKFNFSNTNISNSDIALEPVYQLMPDGKLHLAWQLAIDMTEKADFWNVRVDAQTGEILDKNNWTTHCTFGNHQHTNNCHFLESTHHELPTQLSRMNEKSTMDGSSYNVFPLPLESPLHGNRSIVNEPADPIASPYGWHDTNGSPGAEFTITRGNNAHAYTDLDDLDRSIGNEPDGGADLTFDFPFNQDGEPETYRDAATAQLFYTTNMIHDIAFAYGFTEQAGNFQSTNYSFPAGDGDVVKAEAQDGYNQIPDVDYIGNANFSTPSDGFSGRMQMYVWGRGGGRLLQVTKPDELISNYEVGTASFGPRVEDLAEPIVGQVAIVNDGSFTNSSLGCKEIVNAEEVNGKIAFVDRGICFFSEKATLAQDAGALAVIICNYEESFVNMRAGDTYVNGSLQIPIVSLRQSDCQVLKTAINQGLEIKLESPPPTGPDYYDGDFDNGVVVHEYGHGISNRLTGGRSNTSCLSNDEQMGEGWSDFFTLITTVRPGDTGKEQRGIGNYLLRKETNAQGVRRFPYSTDMSICPFTYKDIIGTVAPHSVGEVWGAALWDLYWAMSDEYGWSEDIYNGNGGNNNAIQLVMDGMKIQPCRPGIIDGRDAILAADRANNGGANECLIWEVFARRGMGFSAKQGDDRDRNDAIEAYDLPPSCTNALAIAKTATENITAGGEIDYVLRVSNNKSSKVTNLVVTDNLPEGVTLKSGSASMAVSETGNTIRFEIPELASGASMEINYKAVTGTGEFSTRQFFDDMEDGDDFWLIVSGSNTNRFELQEERAKSGLNAWHVVNPSDESKQFLQLDEELIITGDQPSLRFSHWYDIDEGTNGGIVEITTNGGASWQDLGAHFIRNGYVGDIYYQTFATPDLKAFWGDSEQFVDSYIDLSAFKGERVSIRFRFGSTGYENGDIPNKSYAGWYIDDVEFLDLYTYQSEACATTAEGDNVCATAANGGTVVEAGAINTSVQDLEELGLQFEVSPNPAADYLNIVVSNENTVAGTVSLYNLNGQQLKQKSIRIDQSTQIIPFNVHDFAAGFYFVKVETNEGIAVKKIIIE